MTLILSGTDGLSDVDGSAATPAIRGTDTNTGMFFPAADTIAFAEGGAESMRIDSSGNLGLGTTTTTTYRATIANNGGNQLRLYATDVSTTTTNTIDFWYLDSGGSPYNNTSIRSLSTANAGNGNLVFYTRPTSGSLTETMRINSSGYVTMPFQPNAALGLNTSQTSAGVIIWTVVHNNVGSCYNSGTGLFTAPVAGYYLAAIMVMTDALASTIDVELQKNGGTNNQLVPYQGGTGAPQYNQVSGMTIILLAAGDTISFKLNSGTIYGGGSSGRHSACTFRLMG